jgi:hypothetical protein
MHIQSRLFIAIAALSLILTLQAPAAPGKAKAAPRQAKTAAPPSVVPDPARLVDPIAGLDRPGRSAQRLAMPVGLPVERILPGPITDWVLLTMAASGKKE